MNETLNVYAEFIPIVLPGDKGFKALGWCRDHNSSDRFYNASNGWYFEHKGDALLFTLRWGTQ